MTDSEEELLKTGLYVGGAYAVYLVAIKPILAYFGATQDQLASIKNVDDTPPPDNPFSNQFAPYVAIMDANAGNYGTDANGTPVTTVNEYYQVLKADYDLLNPVPPLTWEPPNPINTAIAAEAIYNSFGFFKFAGDYDTVNAVFNSFESKQQVAGVSDYLYNNYGADLWTFLKNGSGGSFRGMKAADLATIADRVNNLPDTN